MPELDDDTDLAPVAAAASDEGQDDEAPAKVDASRPEKVDPREEIVKRYRERQRAAAAAEPADDVGSDDSTDDAPVEAANEDEPEVDAAPAKAAPAKDAPEEEPVFTLLVDGKPTQMKQSEVLAKAQIAVASDDRLEEAKRLLKEARALRGRNDDSEHHRYEDDDLNGQDDQAPESTSKANQPALALDKDKLRDIVQRLQVGDEEEGVEALAEVVSLLGEGQGKQAVTPEEVWRLVARSQLQSEMQSAAESFQKDHAAVIEDEELREVTFNRLRNEVRKDLAALGMPAQDLAKLNGEQLFTLHMDARTMGAKLRNYNAMFDQVGKDMTTRYGAVIQPTSTQVDTTKPTQAADQSRIAQDRIDRKRTEIQQPRTVGMRQAPPPQRQAKTKADIIAEMRRARGFDA